MEGLEGQIVTALNARLWDLAAKILKEEGKDYMVNIFQADYLL